MLDRYTYSSFPDYCEVHDELLPERLRSADCRLPDLRSLEEQQSMKT